VFCGQRDSSCVCCRQLAYSIRLRADDGKLITKPMLRRCVKPLVFWFSVDVAMSLFLFLDLSTFPEVGSVAHGRAASTGDNGK